VAPQGTIKTRDYPNKNYDNNQTCEWLIATDPSHTLTFQLTDFDLERTINCSKDYLMVIDSKFDEVLWKGCGNELPNVTTFRSKRNELTVVLVTDDSITAKGFVGNYSINCGARIVTSDYGELKYQKSTDEKVCYWTIISEDPSKHVALTFTFMNLFNTIPDYCFADISVHEGDVDSLGAQRVKFCGGKAPPTIFSNGNALTIIMNTTSFAAFAEFDIHYSVADNACGGTYKSFHAEFGSPNYPNTSPLNSYCIWQIPAAKGNKISLTLKDVSIAL
jgi:cubilin